MQTKDLYDIIPYLESLEDRWDSYKAKKPSEKTIRKYKNLLKHLKKNKFDFDMIRDVGAVVGHQGGVGMTIIKGDLEYVIEILENYNLVTQVLNLDKILSVLIVSPCITKLVNQMKIDFIIKV